MTTIKKHLNLSVPADVRDWIVKEAGHRRMTMSDYVLSLITRGILAESIEESVAKVRAATESLNINREVLRQTLAMRYMVEAQAKGTFSSATIGTDANSYAERELAKLWPQ